MLARPRGQVNRAPRMAAFVRVARRGARVRKSLHRLPLRLMLVGVGCRWI